LPERILEQTAEESLLHIEGGTYKFNLGLDWAVELKAISSFVLRYSNILIRRLQL